MTVLFNDARQRAKALDAEFAATGQLKGPLHGVPFSLKVRLAIICVFLLLTMIIGPMFALVFILGAGANILPDDVAGFDSTIGFTSWAGKPAEKDALVLQRNRI